MIVSGYCKSRDFTVTCGAAYEVPLNQSDVWEPFPTFGAAFLCPARDSNMSVGICAYYGELKSDTISVTNAMLHTEVSFNYRFSLPVSFMSIDGTIALVDWAVKIPAEKKSDNLSLIASWENEFGAAAGVALNLHKIKNVVISVPARCSVIFSSPEQYCSFSIGLSVGYVLHVGKND